MDSRAFLKAITSPRPNRDGTRRRKNSQSCIIANNKSPRMTSPELIDIPADKRIEPSILTDLEFDDDTRHTPQPTSHRVLSATLLVSVMAHVLILLMAAYAAQRNSHPIEQTLARPTIQIRFQPPPSAPADSPVQSAAVDPAPEAVDDTPVPEAGAPVETSLPLQPPADQPEPAATETLAETPTNAPPRPLPSLTELRTAARNHAEQNRHSRTTHPDCLNRERRSAFLDCEDQQPYDFASAEQNATVVFFPPALPVEADTDSAVQTSTGARVNAAIDLFDSQLGTTQTKKRLMHVP